MAVAPVVPLKRPTPAKRPRRKELGDGRNVVASELAACPRGNIWRTSCKRRDCPFCGPKWARRWEMSTRLNLEAFGGELVMVAITPPGAERLPWDEAHCAGRKPHKHKGPSGCRVQERAAREWSDTLTLRWSLFRLAAMNYTRRQLGIAPRILERVYEPQKRGVPHVHIVLGYRTPLERQAVYTFVARLKELQAEYDFGNVDGKFKPVTAAVAARYLARYLTGRSRKKGTIRENIAHPNMPASLIWLTPTLTSLAKGGTGITIRTLRRAGHLWAAVKGNCPPPAWTSAVEAVLVGAVYRRAFGPKRAPPAGAIESLLATASVIDFALEVHPPGWERLQQSNERDRMANQLALAAAGLSLTMPFPLAEAA